MRKLWKAVKVEDGEYYCLGMGSAQPVHLPMGRWLDGGEHGFTCGATESIAKGVAYQIKRRKVLPIPEDIRIIEVLAKVRYEKSWGAVVCDEIYLPS